MVKEFGIRNTIIYLFIVFMFFVGVCYADTVANSPLYKATVEVVNVEGEVITIETETYQEYQFYGTGFHKGDTVIVTFDTKGDNDFNNDEVTNVIKK